MNRDLFGLVIKRTAVNDLDVQSGQTRRGHVNRLSVGAISRRTEAPAVGNLRPQRGRVDAHLGARDPYAEGRRCIRGRQSALLPRLAHVCFVDPALGRLIIRLRRWAAIYLRLALITAFGSLGAVQATPLGGLCRPWRRLELRPLLWLP